MKVKDVVEILDAKIHCGEGLMDLEIKSACGADLMSDVMAFVKEKVVLLTGLITTQTIRTADLMDIRVVILVRGKIPTSEMIQMAETNGMTLLSTKNTMFIACGRLYEAGLRQHGAREIE
jgi:hypothetical protein